MENKLNSEREYEYDFMRALAAVAVVCTHTCATQWRSIDVYSTNWFILTIYHMLCKSSVPLFFMISGRFYLDESRNFSLKSMITKKIPGLIVAFFFWSLLYMIENLIRSGSFADNWKWIALEFFSGEYHMWFIFAIACLYLITPFLKAIIFQDKLCKYFLLLFIIFQFVFPLLTLLPHIGTVFLNFQSNTHMFFVLGYSGHYVLGWYLKKHTLSPRKALLFYVLGLLGAAFSIISTVYLSYNSGKTDESLSECFTWNVAMPAFAVYVAFMQRNERKCFKYHKTISVISKYSFGIYLSHPLILWIFSLIGFMPDFINPLLGVPVVTASATVISLLLSILLRKIPKLGKLIT